MDARLDKLNTVMRFRSCNRFPHNKSASAVHALFITRVNNSASYRCLWSNASVWDLQLVLLQRWTRTGFPKHSCIAEALHSPSKGFKDSEPTSSAGQGKAHRLLLCSIKEKMWRPFAFFYWRKKKKTSREEWEAEVDLGAYSFSG